MSIYTVRKFAHNYVLSGIAGLKLGGHNLGPVYLYMLVHACVCMCVCVHALRMFCAFFANQYVLYTYANCYVSAMNKLNKHRTVQKFSRRKF